MVYFFGYAYKYPTVCVCVCEREIFHVNVYMGMFGAVFSDVSVCEGGMCIDLSACLVFFSH